MRRERFQNASATTLGSTINDSTTSVSVADGSVFPSEGDFRVIVDSEILLVTARSSNTLTVERGAESTTAASHQSGTDIVQILTEEAVARYVREGARLHGYSPALRIYDAAGAIADASDFTWLNQGSASTVDANGGILLKTPGDANNQIRGKYLSAPSTPYEVVAAVKPFHLAGNQSSTEFASVSIFFRDSATGELVTFQVLTVEDRQAKIEVARYDDTTTFDSVTAGEFWAGLDDLVWMKMEDNGTNTVFSISPDGENWLQILSESRTAFLTNGPDQIGFATNPNGVSSHEVWSYVHHFSVE